ncbi:hypothetical protein JHW43_001107 [Diplocarpon mali]|nr:hypothetical protein JHW43_001107 [Diplocarpon mali]
MEFLVNDGSAEDSLKPVFKMSFFADSESFALAVILLLALASNAPAAPIENTLQATVGSIWDISNTTLSDRPTSHPLLPRETTISLGFQDWLAARGGRGMASTLLKHRKSTGREVL